MRALVQHITYGLPPNPDYTILVFVKQGRKTGTGPPRSQKAFANAGKRIAFMAAHRKMSGLFFLRVQRRVNSRTVSALNSCGNFRGSPRAG